MSADQKLELKAKTDNGSTHTQVLHWAALLREKPGVRLTRDDVIASFMQDPATVAIAEEIKKKVPKSSQMWLVEAGTGFESDTPTINMTVRYG